MRQDSRGAGASPVTIRRDLTELEAQRSLRRTRGGAARSGKVIDAIRDMRADVLLLGACSISASAV